MSADASTPVRCGAWMDEAEAALVLAENAERNCGLEGDCNSLVALEVAVRGLRAAIALARPPSSIDPKLSDRGGAVHRLRKSGWGRRRWEQPV